MNMFDSSQTELLMSAEFIFCENSASFLFVFIIVLPVRDQILQVVYGHA